MRVVLDTNVVISALLFQDGRLTWLRKVWVEGRCIPLVSGETVRELLAVLAYPKFQLAQGDREELLATYLPHTEVVQIQAVLEEIPKCSDKDDQMFLQLAFAGKADLIVTGDKGLLQMRDECPFSILTPTEARKELLAE